MGCGSSAQSRVAAADHLVGPTQLCFGDEGAVLDSTALIKLIAGSAGIAPELRGRLWLHLLGVVPWDAGQTQYAETLDANVAAFAALLDRATNEADSVKDRRVIEADIPRTDRREMSRMRIHAPASMDT